MNVPSKGISHTKKQRPRKDLLPFGGHKLQGSGAGSTTTKAQLHQELRTLNREMEAFIKGD